MHTTVLPRGARLAALLSALAVLHPPSVLAATPCVRGPGADTTCVAPPAEGDPVPVPLTASTPLRAASIPLPEAASPALDPAATQPELAATVLDPASALPLVPVVDVSPHNGDYAFNTFPASMSYATPSYVSLDVPRSVALAYVSSQARPLGFVQLDVSDAAAPAQYSLRLQRSDNTYVDFTNGSSELFFQGGAGTRRIAAQFDASSLATGVYGYTAVVTGVNGTVRGTETRVSVRVVIVNERTSPMGAGWSVPGVKRLHLQANGSAVLTGGDGTAAYFARACPSCPYVPPPGDFTTLTPSGGFYYRTHRDNTQEKYDAAGRLLSVTDRLGNATTFTYDVAGRIHTVRDPANLAYTFAYTTGGKLASITDPAGRLTWVTVDAAGDLTQIVDPGSGYALRATYDAQHRVLTRTDRRGSVWNYAYDHGGALANVQMPTVRVLRSGAEVDTRPTVVYQSLESRVVPAPGTGTTAAPAPGATGPVAVTVTDPRGNVTSRVLNRFGAATSITEPQGRTTTLEYNASAQLTRLVTPAGREMRYYYTGAQMDSSYNVNTNKRLRYKYGVFGQLTETYDGYRRVVYGLDAQGRVQTSGLQGGTSSTFTYDTRGRVTSITDPGGHVTRYYYGAAPFMNTDSVVSDGPQRKVSTTYDGLGRPRTVSLPTGGVQVLYQDVLNRDSVVVMPGGDTIRYAYDALYLTSVTDPAGAVRRFGYNALGWLTSETDPANYTSHALYDDAGNLVRRTSRAGRVVNLAYDAYNRVVQRTAGGQTSTYAYDPLGRWTAASNAEATDTTWYNLQGQPTHAVTQLGGVRYEKTYSWTLGSLVSMGVRSRRYVDEQTCVYTFWLNDPNKQLDCQNYWVVNYSRGPAGELTGVAHAGHWVTGEDLQVPESYGGDIYSYSTSVGRNAERQAATLRLTPADTVSRVFSGFHLPSSVTYSRDSLDYALGGAFTRDLLGRMKQRTWANGDSVRSWDYDTRGRLGGIGHMYDQWQVHWDRMGNPTDSGAVVAAGNRLRYYRAAHMQYDLDGSPITREVPGHAQYLTFNALGQLSEVLDYNDNQDETHITFGYDAYGRRVRKTVNGTSVYYLNDGHHLLAEINEWGGIRRAYANNPGVDEPHSVAQDDSVYFYLLSEPGNVVGLMNRQGALVNRYDYTPFGELRSIRERVPNELRFGARPYDAETGMYYNRARYYDPYLRRFISEDPVGLAGGLNPYVFADNNPVVLRDPSGLYPDCIPQPGQPSLNGSEEELGTRYDPYCILQTAYAIGTTQGYRVMNAMETWIYERTQEVDRILDRAGVHDFMAGVAAAQQKAVDKGCGENIKGALVSGAFDALGMQFASSLAKARSINATGVGFITKAPAAGDPVASVFQQQMGIALLSTNDVNIVNAYRAGAAAGADKLYQMMDTEWGAVAHGGGAGVYELAKLVPLVGTGLEIGEAIRACLF